MKSKHHNSLGGIALIIATLAVLFSSCASDITTPLVSMKDTIYVDEGATPPRQIYGYVELQRNCDLLAQAEGVRVTIDSLGLTTTTDRSGRYAFNGLQWQPYTMTFEKEGYYTVQERMGATMSNTGLRFYPQRLDAHSQISAKFIGDTVMNVYYGFKDTLITDTNGIRHRGTVRADTNFVIYFIVDDVDALEGSRIYLLVSHSPNIDPLDTSTYAFSRGEDTDLSDRFVALVSTQLWEYGFKPGDTYYVALAARSFCASTGYGQLSEVRQYQVPVL